MTTININRKRSPVLGAITAIGEVALTVTISGAALLAVGIGVPSGPAAQAHAAPAVAFAQGLTSKA